MCFRCAVRATTDKEALGDNESYENFHPTFTYPVCMSPLKFLTTFSLTLFQIYGEDEKIYGYTDLVIDVRFACI